MCPLHLMKRRFKYRNVKIRKYQLIHVSVTGRKQYWKQRGAHMDFPLWWLSSHECIGKAVFRMTFPVTGLVIAFKLARAPVVIEGAAAASLLAKLHIIIDHLIWICVEDRKEIKTHEATL